MKNKCLLIVAFVLISINSYAQWEELGGALSIRLTHSSSRPEMYGLATDDSGNVYASGIIDNASGFYYVTKYDRKLKVWSELGDAASGGTPLKANNSITKIATDHLGNVYATGFFTNSMGNTYIAKWEKATNAWIALDTLIPGENIVVDKSNNVYTNAYDATLKEDYIAKWDGTKWSKYGTSIGKVTTGLFTGGISKIAIDDSNKIYALMRSFIVINNGIKWTDTIELSGPYINATSQIYAMAIDPDRNIYLGGKIPDPSGLSSVNVFKLDTKTKFFDKLSHKTPPFTFFAGSDIVNTIVSISSTEVYVGGMSLHDATPLIQVIKWSKTTDNWSVVGNAGDILVGNTNAILIDTSDKRNDLLTVGRLFNSSIGGMNVDQFIGHYKHNCNTYFTIVPTAIPHSYTLTNYCYGTGKINYKWNWGDGSPLDTGATPTHIYSSAGIYQICVEITDSLGCSSSYCTPKHSYLAKATGMISVNVVKGILPASKIDEVKTTIEEINVYPNPTNNHIVVSGKGIEKEIQIKILDLLGKEVLTDDIFLQNGIYRKEFNLMNLQSGLYFVHLKSSEISKTIKIYKN